MTSNSLTLPLAGMKPKTAVFLLAFCAREKCTPEQGATLVLNTVAEEQMPAATAAAATTSTLVAAAGMNSQGGGL